MQTFSRGFKRQILVVLGVSWYLASTTILSCIYELLVIQIYGFSSDSVCPRALIRYPNFPMASETHSCEMIFQDPLKEKNSKQQVVFTKWKLMGLITVIFLIFGVLLIPLYLNQRSQNEKFDRLSDQIESLSNDIEELKTNEEIWKEKVHSKNSYANYVRVGDFGYFQKLDDKMSYEDGQAACHELHGNIIESDERNENATSKYSF